MLTQADDNRTRAARYRTQRERERPRRGGQSAQLEQSLLLQADSNRPGERPTQRSDQSPLREKEGYAKKKEGPQKPTSLATPRLCVKPLARHTFSMPPRPECLYARRGRKEIHKARKIPSMAAGENVQIPYNNQPTRQMSNRQRKSYAKKEKNKDKSQKARNCVWGGRAPMQHPVARCATLTPAPQT